MSALLKYPWHSTNVRWSEADIQAAIVQTLRRERVPFEVGLDGVKMSKGQACKAKVQGMDRGKCDIKIYFEGGQTCQIELKKKGGRTSDAQDDWHEWLSRLGHDVRVLKCATPQEGVDRVMEIVEEYEFR